MTITQLMQLSSRELNKIKKKDFVKIINSMKKLYNTVKYDTTDIDVANSKLLIAIDEMDKYIKSYNSKLEEYEECKSEFSAILSTLKETQSEYDFLRVKYKIITNSRIYKILKIFKIWN